MIQIDMPMPKCCDECFALDDHGDYPFCLISKDQRGYNFNVREKRMPTCLLKAQEPRVLTLAELEYAEVAYAEDIDKDEIIPILVNGRQYDRFSMVRARLGNSPSRVFHPSFFDYNKRWRCWTSRPTDEQRKEMPWQ